MGKPSIMRYIIENYDINKNKISQKLGIEFLQNKVIAIDLYQLMYKFLHNEHKHYLTSMICYLIYLNKYNIKPIFVIDGKPPIEKMNILKKRKNKKDKSKNIIDNEENKIKEIERDLENENVNKLNEKDKADLEDKIQKAIENIKKHKKRTAKVSKEHIDNIKKLFDLLQYPYIHNTEREADYVCAQLVINNIAFACLSNDFDLITHQCPLVIRDFNIVDNTFTIYSLDKISKLLGLSIQDTTNMIILNGTDYQSKRHPYDFKYIHTLLKQNLSIDKVRSLLHFGKIEYENVYKIFVEFSSKEQLLNEIKFSHNINKNERFIDEKELEMFKNTSSKEFCLKNKDVYYLSNNLDKLTGTINMSDLF